MMATGFPFAAVAGHRAAKRALLLLAVEPGLRGAIIASKGGSTESTLARAFGWLPDGEEPPRPQMTRQTANDWHADTGLVEIPLGVTQDRLIGAVDVERTLASGKREMLAGLLAQAHRRALFVNDINLLESGIAAHIAQALDERRVRVERDGLSTTCPADFVLVGTMNRDEGEPHSLLRDRVGLIVDSESECSADERAQMIDREFRFNNKPSSFIEEFTLETAEVRSAIEAARVRLPRVRAGKNQMRQLSHAAMSLGVEGNRADIFALKAARANAALAGRNLVNEDDLVAAIQLVLVPRSTTLPVEEEKNARHCESAAQEMPEQFEGSETNDANRNLLPAPVEDLIIQAIDGGVPEHMLALFRAKGRPSNTGKRFKASTSKRGRYVRSAMRGAHDARVAIEATLCAAAPFQRRRSLTGAWPNAFAADFEDDKELAPRRRVKIEPSDLRFKRFKHRSGILFIFAVDASGSMALNRIGQAKGALTHLLTQAYLHRDKVALISFRGERSEVLLAPTRSVELAKRCVDALPAGGGTPVSAGVLKAIELTRLARLQGMPRAMLVLFTDGRANVSLREATSGNDSVLVDELRQLGKILQSEGISSLVVDTKSRFVSTGEGRELAAMLGARYCYLPRRDSAAICAVIDSAADRR